MGLVRKLLIFASANGLVVQAHGSVDHHKAIHIGYKSRLVTDCSQDEAVKGRKGAQLEVHGIIGMSCSAQVDPCTH